MLLGGGAPATCDTTLSFTDGAGDAAVTVSVPNYAACDAWVPLDALAAACEEFPVVALDPRALPCAAISEHWRQRGEPEAALIDEGAAAAAAAGGKGGKGGAAAGGADKAKAKPAAGAGGKKGDTAAAPAPEDEAVNARTVVPQPLSLLTRGGAGGGRLVVALWQDAQGGGVPGGPAHAPLRVCIERDGTFDTLLRALPAPAPAPPPAGATPSTAGVAAGIAYGERLVLTTAPRAAGWAASGVIDVPPGPALYSVTVDAPVGYSGASARGAWWWLW